MSLPCTLQIDLLEGSTWQRSVHWKGRSRRRTEQESLRLGCNWSVPVTQASRTCMHTPIWAVVKCRLWGNCILNGRESEPVYSSFTTKAEITIWITSSTNSVCARAHTHTHAYIHAYMHTHTSMHTQTQTYTHNLNIIYLIIYMHLNIHLWSTF